MIKTLHLIPLIVTACVHTAAEPMPEATQGLAVSQPVIAEDAIPGVEAATPRQAAPVALSPAEQMHMELMRLREDESEPARAEASMHPHAKFAAGQAVKVWSPYKIEVQARNDRFRVKLAGFALLERELKGIDYDDPFYQASLTWLRNTVSDRPLHVVFDTRQLESDDEGEITAYVFYQPWGTKHWVFLNRQMISEGMALYRSDPGWKHDTELRQAEMDAHFAQRGVWGEQIRRQIGTLPKSGQTAPMPGSPPAQ